jgi:hypothetical protein
MRNWQIRSFRPPEWLKGRRPHKARRHEIERRGAAPRADGRDCIAINLRLAELDQVADIAIRHFNGLEWKDVPCDGRRVADMWS